MSNRNTIERSQKENEVRKSTEKQDMKKLYQTSRGTYQLGDSKELIEKGKLKKYKGKVNLLITSPPFPLNKKKRYGNFQGEAYREWFVSLAPLFSDLLAEDGSIVIELGNAWEAERPVQSLLPLESLLGFVKNEAAGLRLMQEFICYNPSRLPSPAKWVTRKRMRTVDSYTHVWWIAKSDFPKADNSRVLRPYSKSMKNLLKRQDFNRGRRPSGHHISENGFLSDNGGSIAHNFFEMDPLEKKRKVRLPEVTEEFAEDNGKLPHNVLSLSNTSSNDYFSRTLRERNIRRHPATMHPGLVAFFIKFLTDEGDLVLDPFAGSNTTGYCAEKLNRRWLSIEINEEYGKQSMIRFEDPELEAKLK